jgi:hypothetical protein
MICIFSLAADFFWKYNAKYFIISSVMELLYVSLGVDFN